MMKLSKKHIFLLLALSSILLSLPWFSQFSGVILFIAFLPLLILERVLYENRASNKSSLLLLYSTLVFVFWNIATTFWIYNATLFGAIAAVIIGSFLMSMAFWLFHITHRKLGHGFGYFAFITYWIGQEHLYLNGEISFPWLSLGNGFAKDIHLIQWYEFTGSTGGTAWVLFINLLLFLILWNFIQKGNIRGRIVEAILVFFIIFVPVTYSFVRFNRYKENNNPKEFVVIQPNIDPYNDKFDGLSNAQQLEIILQLADSLTGPETDYVIGPETSVNDNIWENNLDANRSIKKIKNFVRHNPSVKFIIGLTSFYQYSKEETPSSTARQFSDSGDYYDIYNASIQIDSTASYQLYHKSKLVVGVEKVPFPRLLKKMERLVIDLGGTTGGYGTQPERSTLDELYGSTKTGTLICYESVYGDFVTDYIHQGANILLVITNDGWWGNTPGYKQLLSFTSLRAIETRRSIARSANTGISCFINQKGEISQATKWWVPAVIKGKLNLNEEITFYVKHGDFISRILSFFGIITILYTIVALLIAKKGQ